MSRLSCLDSSSSSDDDEPELILSALHQAHTQYLALNSHVGEVLYLAGTIFIEKEKVAILDSTMTISRSIQPMGNLYSDAGLQISWSIHLPSFLMLFLCVSFFILISLLRFRMARPLFLRIMQAIEQHDNYFVQKKR